LLSHGLAFVHCSTPTSEARAGAGYPLGLSKPPRLADGSPERNFFAAAALRRLQVDWKVGA
jgi:hypothetical protein